MASSWVSGRGHSLEAEGEVVHVAALRGGFVVAGGVDYGSKGL